mmetsp:Transcript_18697/g.20876  ORF Transcript_18697/g.20876 Transcript_18697/m.20876 type:complete len:210 (-) Transcript_18697:45-674(-)
MPPGIPGPPWGSLPLPGFLTVSSMERIRHAASVAASKLLSFTTTGSQRKLFIVSHTSSLMMSTPNHWPPSWKCLWRSLFKIVVASRPALSQIWWGITSSALAKALMMSCCLPWIVREYSRRYLLTSISIAPPPATIEECLRALLTTMMASWIDLSISAMNCSPPPRRMIVAVVALEQPLKKLKRSPPTWFSSKRAQLPRISSPRSFTVV